MRHSFSWSRRKRLRVNHVRSRGVQIELFWVPAPPLTPSPLSKCKLGSRSASRSPSGKCLPGCVCVCCLLLPYIEWRQWQNKLGGWTDPSPHHQYLYKLLAALGSSERVRVCQARNSFDKKNKPLDWRACLAEWPKWGYATFSLSITHMLMMLPPRTELPE
jgi:hypothetical protein